MLFWDKKVNTLSDFMESGWPITAYEFLSLNHEEDSTYSLENFWPPSI